MPLKNLVAELSNMECDEPEVISSSPKFIFAQKCQGWNKDSPEHRATIVYCYRSVLVTDTMGHYQPVAEHDDQLLDDEHGRLAFLDESSLVAA